MDVHFGIASYRRADNQRTIEYLESLGVDKSRILVSVQTREDYEAYTAAGIDCRAKLIYRHGENVSDNRNNILDHFPPGTKIVMLDDDLKCINRLNAGKLTPIRTGEELERLLKHGYALAAKHRTVGFGLYPVNNAFYMSKGYASRSVVIGTFFAVVNTDLRFDREMTVKEDYEYSCKAIRRYGAFVRLNNFACDAQHKSKGGCEELWSNTAEMQRTARRLAGLYPDIVKLNAKKPGEITMIKTGGKK